MCYSGKCRWEDYTGDCRFPMYVKVISVKYKHPNCNINIQSVEEQQHVDEINDDVKKIINNRNKSK
jgi:hypothetical protein